MRNRRWTRRIFRSDLVPVAAVVSVIVALTIAAPFILDAVWGNVPMVFYGRVVDENGRGVGGAQVSMQVVAERRLQIPAMFSSSHTGWATNAVTDESGNFVVRGVRGIYLKLNDVSKPGYGQVTVEGTGSEFYYSSSTGTAIYHPDPARPAIFHLRS